jgi:F420-0:gamma-glutamyl ligase
VAELIADAEAVAGDGEEGVCVVVFVVLRLTCKYSRSMRRSLRMECLG